MNFWPQGNFLGEKKNMLASREQTYPNPWEKAGKPSSNIAYVGIGTTWDEDYVDEVG